MNYKIEETLKRNKIVLIIAPILWLAVAIGLIMPITCGIYGAHLKGGFDSDTFATVFATAIAHPVKGFKTIANRGLFGSYFKGLFGFTLFYVLIIVIGLIRTAPKHRYDSIEHGSSDWSESGAQYQILSRKSGIILSEGNYLPVNKRGNVNVLVVGRIRFW
jgi:hypothetical protein